MSNRNRTNNPARRRHLDLPAFMLFASVAVACGEPEPGQLAEGTNIQPDPIDLSGVGGADGFVLNGELSQDRAGFSVSGIGDFNGDGLPDFAVGAYGWDSPASGAGRVYVILGSGAALPGTAPVELSDIGTAIPGAVIDGLALGDSLGTTVAAAGDVNGDGLADLAISAPSNDSNGSNAGAVYVVFGTPTLSPSVSLAAVAAGNGGFLIEGTAAGDQAGRGLGALGDFDADGYDDLIVGSPYSDAGGSNSGTAHIVYGRATWPSSIVLTVEVATGQSRFAAYSAGDRLGTTVAGLGDVNGDGYPDAGLGAPYQDTTAANAGRTYVVYGTPTRPEKSELPDIALGIGGAAFDGENASDYAGAGLSTASDFNGDGVADFLIGANGSDAAGTSAGRAYVIFGSASLEASSPLRLSTITAGAEGIAVDGEFAYDNLGRGLAPAGDVNEDGLADVLLGSYGYDGPGSSSGRAYVLFGADHPDIASASFDLSTIGVAEIGGFQLSGAAAGDQAGRSVAKLGDVRGTGAEHLAIGSYAADPNGSLSGQVHVVSVDPAPGSYHPYNRRPWAVADELYFRQGGTQHVDAPGVLQNDYDADLDQLIAVPTTGPVTTSEGGTLELFADGSLTYTPPDLIWWGRDSAMYQVEDPDGATRSAALELVVQLATLPLSELVDQDAGFVLDGEADGDQAAQAVAMLGDANGDGRDEVVVGAFSSNTPAESAGRVYIANGRDGSSVVSLGQVANEAEGLAFDGLGRFDWLGISVADIGDHNNTAAGGAELAVGAIGSDLGGNRAGATYVVDLGTVSGSSSIDVLGYEGVEYVGEQADDDAGRAVAGVGDINGDGIEDLGIGAYRADANGEDAGRIYLIYGVPGSLTSDTEDLSAVGGTFGCRIDGAAAGDFAGFALAEAGDVNGDGFDDVLIGAYRADGGAIEGGSAYIIFGAANLPSVIDLGDVESGVGGHGAALVGEANFDWAGRSVAGGVDFNADGLDDFVVGAPAASGAAGRVYVVFGATDLGGASGEVQLSDVAAGSGGLAIDGESGADNLGAAVAAIGDFDGDGDGDFVLGAPQAWSDSGPATGKAYVLLGGSSSFLGSSPSSVASLATMGAGFAVDGEEPGDALGYSLGGRGDVNADGFADVVLGAYAASPGGETSAGRAYVVFGHAVSAGVGD